MAANVNKASSLLFTLPISCQICLGKVKQPVICPNQHVFCADCMEVWLQRNKKCPSCRIDITRENPCRPVLGGLSETETGNNDFASREMRRARMEMLFKDYEREIDRLQRQNELLNEEINLLNERIRQNPAMTTRSSPPVEGNTEGRVKLLSQKLEDTSQLYDLAKRENKRLKEEKRDLEEENGRLTIENKNLRIEMEHRSPRKFGRTAMAAMESRMGEYLKEITALKKALERSDEYIRDLERERQDSDVISAPESSHNLVRNPQSLSKGSKGTMSETTTSTHAYSASSFPLTRPINETESNFDDSALSDGVDTKTSKGKKNGDDDDTFQLELPSPTMPRSKNRDLEITGGNETTMDESGVRVEDSLKDDTLEIPSPVSNIKKRLRFSENSVPTTTLANSLPPNISSMLPQTQRALIGTEHLADHLVGSGPDQTNSQAFLIRPTYSASNQFQVNNGPNSHNANVGLLNSQTALYTNATSASYSATRNVRGLAENGGLNTSITPEMEDCMKLFEEAERKVEVRKVMGSQGDVITRHQRPSSVDRMLHRTTPNNHFGESRTVLQSTSNRLFSDPGTSMAVPEFASSLPVPRSEYSLGVSTHNAIGTDFAFRMSQNSVNSGVSSTYGPQFPLSSSVHNPFSSAPISVHAQSNLMYPSSHSQMPYVLPGSSVQSSLFPMGISTGAIGGAGSMMPGVASGGLSTTPGSSILGNSLRTTPQPKSESLACSLRGSYY